MHGRRPADEDRLPWLEPYRERVAANLPPFSVRVLAEDRA